MITGFALGKAIGALYVPVLAPVAELKLVEMNEPKVPVVSAGHGVEETVVVETVLAWQTLHTTCELVSNVPVTVALKTKVSLVPMLVVSGVTVARMPESMVMLALAVAVVSACETAVTVTIFGTGTEVGAV
jgi:hypothetical protein